MARAELLQSSVTNIFCGLLEHSLDGIMKKRFVEGDIYCRVMEKDGLAE